MKGVSVSASYRVVRVICGWCLIFGNRSTRAKKNYLGHNHANVAPVTNAYTIPSTE